MTETPKKMRLIARLDINNEYVIKGKYLEGLRKVGKPYELAYDYYIQGIDEIIFLDAVASLYDRNSLTDVIKRSCRDVFVPIAVGGGIRTIYDIKLALNAGADKVAINTQAIKNIGFVKQAVEIFGSQAIIGSVVAFRSSNGWEAYMDNAKHKTGRNALEWAEELQDAGVGELLLTSMNKDGLMAGFDINLIRLVSGTVNVPVIACSGAGTPQHIAEVCEKTDCDAVAVASMLHYNKSSVLDIKKHLHSLNIEVRL